MRFHHGAKIPQFSGLARSRFVLDTSTTDGVSNVDKPSPRCDRVSKITVWLGI